MKNEVPKKRKTVHSRGGVGVFRLVVGIQLPSKNHAYGVLLKDKEAATERERVRGHVHASQPVEYIHVWVAHEPIMPL